MCALGGNEKSVVVLRSERGKLCMPEVNPRLLYRFRGSRDMPEVAEVYLRYA
jgi:hypothetical protein